MHQLVAEYGNKLNRKRYNVKLMGSESLNHNPGYAKALLEDPASEQYIDIIGGHIYGNRPLYNMKKTAEIASAHNKETWMTELRGCIHLLFVDIAPASLILKRQSAEGRALVNSMTLR